MRGYGIAFHSVALPCALAPPQKTRVWQGRPAAGSRAPIRWPARTLDTLATGAACASRPHTVAAGPGCDVRGFPRAPAAKESGAKRNPCPSHTDGFSHSVPSHRVVIRHSDHNRSATPECPDDGNWRDLVSPSRAMGPARARVGAGGALRG